MKKTKDGWTARCPVPGHNDKHNSLSIDHRDGKWLIHCRVGLRARGHPRCCRLQDFRPFDERPEHVTQGDVPWPGYTLAEYSAAKQLPLPFLKGLGLTDFTYCKKPAVRIPYFDEARVEITCRYRIAARQTADYQCFHWKKGARAKRLLYGLWRLAEAASAGSVVIVEGESDCHTLWLNDIPAVELTGANMWDEDRFARLFADIQDIIVLVEPDRGGEVVLKWLSASTIRHRARILKLSLSKLGSQAKDPSALYLEDPASFRQRWQVATLGATPWSVAEAKQHAEENAEAWNVCGTLARQPGILDEFAADLKKLRLAGEAGIAKLIFLATISRLFARPISIVVKGPSGGGKSYIVETVLKFVPESAYYALTAMSERALIYSAEPLRHRYLVLYEMAGLNSDMASYLIRSLLSEGCLKYETVETSRRHAPDCHYPRGTDRPVRHHDRGEATSRKRDAPSVDHRHRYPRSYEERAQDDRQWTRRSRPVALAWPAHLDRHRAGQCGDPLCRAAGGKDRPGRGAAQA